MRIALAGDVELSAGPMKGVGPALVVLGLEEIGQHLAVAPAVRAPGRPGVVIAVVTADVDHAVDRAGAAEHPPARAEDRLAADLGVGLVFVEPVVAGAADGAEHPGRDVDQELGQKAPVRWARLDQGHPHARIGRQPVGQDASRRSRPHDHIVEGLAVHARYHPRRRLPVSP